MGSTEEEVQILIQAKNLAGPAIEEAKTLATNLREAIDSLNRSTGAGATVAQAMKQAMNELSRGALEAGLTFDETKNMVNDTRTAMTRYIEVVSGGMAPQEAYNLILDQTIAEMAAATDATEANSAATNSLNGAWLGALNPIGNMKVAIGEVLTVLGPFTLLVASAVVILGTFAVAASAMAITMIANEALFLGLAGAVLLLADHFGTMSGPWTKFKNDLSEMGQDLAAQVAPAAAEIVGWLDKLLPIVESLSSGVLKWFATELPKGLSAISWTLNQLIPQMREFGQFLADAFNHVEPQIGPMFEMFASFGIGAIQGLITNFIRLSDWFQKELPTMGPVVSQIFSAIGNAVQWAATNFGSFADWLSKKWPDIVGVAKSALDGLNQGWSLFNINMNVATASSINAKGIFKDIGIVIGGVAGIVWDLVRVFAIIIEQASAALPAAMASIGQSIDEMGAQFWRAVQGIINAWNGLPGIIRGGTLPNLPGGLTSLTGAGGSVGGGPTSTGRSTGIQSFAEGGTVQGPPGAAIPVIAHAGEAVLSNSAQDQMVSLLQQLVSVALAQLDQMGSGSGYSALATLEYNRSRGIQ